jgi:dTDP-4-dehydrorhamnose reductase
MKFFVLGAAGMAGHTISMYLEEQGHEVVGFDMSRALYIKTSITGDARDTAMIAKVIKEGQFNAVINCIGILNHFAEEKKALAVFLNSYFPHFLADVTSDMKTMVVHMSTDCVFSGKKGSYSENDLRDGETFYDRSKALGELQDGKNVTLRNSIVGPDMNPRGIGLFNWFMQQKGEISGYTRAMWTGQTTLQLAKTMEAAVREGATGLYNMVPDKSISKYDLLRLFNRHLRNNSITISPIDMNAFDKSLKRTHFVFPYIIPDYEEMVAQMSSWIRRHAALYPHYQLQEAE